MRKSIFLLPVILINLVFLNSCQKETLTDDAKKEIISKVNAWLDSKKPANKTTQSANVELLRNNLDFSALRIEQSAQDEKIVIIPVREDLKTAKNIDKTAIPNLVLILDNSGNIRKGNLVLFLPEDGQSYNKIPGNTFYKILNTGEPNCSGTFKYLSVTGKRLHELEYQNGKLKSFGYLKDSSINNSTARTNFCVDWYWVYTWHDEDGVVWSQYWEYYGSTCQGQDCEDPYDAMLCPMDASSGGGTGDDAQGYEFAVSKPWKWPVAFLYTEWTVHSYETISGVKKSGEPCGGHFTNIVHESSYLVTGQGYTWTQFGNTVSKDTPCYVKSYVTGKVTRNSSGQWTLEEKELGTWFDFEFP